MCCGSNWLPKYESSVASCRTVFQLLSGQPSSGRDLKAELGDYKSEWQPLLRKLRTELFGSNWGLIEVRSIYIYIYIYIVV